MQHLAASLDLPTPCVAADGRCCSDCSKFVADNAGAASQVLPQQTHEFVTFSHNLPDTIHRYLAKLSQEGTAQLSPIVGAALLANAGPREFMPKLRWFRSQRSLWHAARVFLWMLKRPVHDRRLVREMFFSDDLPEQDFQR